jgi:hypothetical protein
MTEPNPTGGGTLTVRIPISIRRRARLHMIKLVPVATVLLMLMGGPTFARTEHDCDLAWATADTNKDGFLTAEEGSRYFAALGLGDKSLADGKLSKSDFMAHCLAGRFDARPAPRKGANSFTEGEAKERILTRGYRNVSGLKMDTDGIWRGTAELNGVKVNVAVDYMGNVVSAYP